MVIRSLLSNCKKECLNDRRSQKPGLQVWLHHRSRMSLQSLHLQELQLLSPTYDAPSVLARGCNSSARTVP